MTTTLTRHELRFTTPLYTIADAARYLVVPSSTLTTWADGYKRTAPSGTPVIGAPIITAGHGTPRHPRLPFVGVAEAYVLNAFRRAGVPMQRIRPSLERLVAEVGPHALASKDLYTDGAEVLWDFAQTAGDSSDAAQVAKQLLVPRSGQYVFKEIVAHYLQQISFDPDDKIATKVRLTQYGAANVVLDPLRGYGEPIFDRSGVRVVDALGPLQAGDSFKTVAADYGVTEDELRDALDAIAA